MAGYKQAFRKAFPYTIPVLTGYLFIGIAFGVMFAEKGYSFLWAMLMSLMVYAGSGQYLAVNFFVPGCIWCWCRPFFEKEEKEKYRRPVFVRDLTYESVLLDYRFCHRWDCRGTYSV